MITGDEQTLGSVARVNQAIASMYHTMGIDHAVGVKLPAMLQRLGLHNLSAEYDAPLCTGESGMDETVCRTAMRQVLATGIVMLEDLARYERFAQDPQAWGIHDATVTVTGQKSS